MDQSSESPSLNCSLFRNTVWRTSFMTVVLNCVLLLFHFSPLFFHIYQIPLFWYSLVYPLSFVCWGWWKICCSPWTWVGKEISSTFVGYLKKVQCWSETTMFGTKLELQMFFLSSPFTFQLKHGSGIIMTESTGRMDWKWLMSWNSIKSILAQNLSCVFVAFYLSQWTHTLILPWCDNTYPASRKKQKPKSL